MFALEAQRINHHLAALPADGIGPILNLGSSSAREREVDKPWVDQFLFRPIRESGGKVVHLDIAAAEGVDLVADIFTEEGVAMARAVAPRTVLLCNVLEHVFDPEGLARRAFSLLPSGGHLVVSVPRSYPHHRSPIDNMFRPTPQQVAALIPEGIVVSEEIIAPSSYLEDVKRRPWILLRQILRAPFPFVGWNRYKRTMKKLYWLFNPYLVTIVVIRKP